MSDPVFVIDAHDQPLMPLSAAHARRLMTRGKAQWVPNPAFRVIQLGYVVEQPQLRPLVLALAVRARRADCWLVAEGHQRTFPLAHIMIDLHTDLSARIRRRAEHRRRRRARHRTSSVPEASNYRHRAQSPWRGTPLMQWRVQAIQRVIVKLQALMPISDVLIMAPERRYAKHWHDLSLAERRHIVRERDGAHCAYCGRVDDHLEVDHVLPRSQGGTDALMNLVLACQECNARKGARTPAQAGMIVNVLHKTPHSGRQREHAHAYQTTQLLYKQLPGLSVNVIWQRPDAVENPLPHVITTTLANWAITAATVGQWIAKPIARLRQQRFYARNYPLSTPTSATFIKIGTTVKRRVAVNQSVAVWRTAKPKTQVIRTTDAESADATFHIRRGMVCEIQQGKQWIRGIVGAIHSTGRITLLIPRLQQNTIIWKRVAATVRTTLRVISRDGVVFLRLSTEPTE